MAGKSIEHLMVLYEHDVLLPSLLGVHGSVVCNSKTWLQLREIARTSNER